MEYMDSENEQSTTFQNMRKQYKEFYDAVKNGHDTTTLVSHRGHGFDHDVTVASLALLIAETKEIGIKAWCAALLHSVDRIVEEEKVKETMNAYASNLVSFFSSDEIHEIVEAAFRHSEINQSDQSDVQITLMDADRLANMQSAVIIRAGQFRSAIPAFDFKYLDGTKDPLSTYETPMTILDNLKFIIIRYVPQFRVPKAKQLGELYASRLQAYIQLVENDYNELGLSGIEL
jgi:hypothetical protein